MLCKIAKFQVHAFISLSNHCPISCSLLSSLPGDDMGAQEQLFPLPGKFLWNPVSIEIYTEKVRTRETQQKLQSFVAQDFGNCDRAANAFSSLLCETASASTKFIKDPIPYERKVRNKPWFSQSCKELHSIVKNMPSS